MSLETVTVEPSVQTDNLISALERSAQTDNVVSAIGEIKAIKKNGLAFLTDCSSGKQYAFTFDKIQGYFGHTAREIGLRKGSKVQFNASAGEVTSVQLPKTALPELLTIPEVASWLRVSERLVYNMIKRGELPHVKIGRLMRVRTEALRSLVSD